MGKNYLENGNEEGAARYFRKVLDLAPESEFAVEAHDCLDRLRE